MPSNEQVDVLIIGSGPAGSTYARTIGEAAPATRILMVEVGPNVPGPRGEHTQNMTPADRELAQLVTQGPDAGIVRETALEDIAPGIDPSLEFRQTMLPGLFFNDPRPVLPEGEVGLPAASMSSGVGGMGIHWGTSCPRPHQSERIPFIPSDELDAALDQAEELLNVNVPEGEGTGLLRDMRRAIAAEFDGPGLTPAQFMPTATHWDGESIVFSGTGQILGALEDTVPGFELRAETLARRIVIEDGRAVGAVLYSRATGDEYTVRADRVVVCADSLRTPQLLFASGVRPRALGHYLNEHFQMITLLTLSDEFDYGRYASEKNSIGSVLVPFSDSRPMQMGAGALATSAYALTGAHDPATNKFGIVALYASKDIQFSDHIEFSETETDFYGLPKMLIHYSRTERDLATIDELGANSRRLAGVIGTLDTEPELAAGGSSLHYQGTVRMGASDDGESVCDPHLKVWGVDGLYVGGNGVIPTSTAANPTLTSVALAWRAASRIAEELVHERAVDAGVRVAEAQAV